MVAAAHPTNLGFLLLVVPKLEALFVYQEQIKNTHGEYCPKFHLIISAVFPKQRTRNTQEGKQSPQIYIQSQVVMIHAAELY